MIVRRDEKIVMVEDMDKNQEIEEPVIKNKEYYLSKEYGDTIKVGVLKKLVSKEVLEQANASLQKYNEVEKFKKRLHSKVMVCLLLTMLSVGLLVVVPSILKVEKIVETEIIFLCFLLIWMIALPFSIWVDILINRKKENAYKEMEEIERNSFIKDESGQHVKAIWFLYHNLPFTDSEQKEAFLEENYKDLNYKFGVSLEDYEGSGNYQEDYLEDIIKRNVEDYLAEDESEEDYVRL